MNKNNEIINKKRFDYISILAGGKCKFNCDFCVGKNIRKDIKPHFSKKYKSFLECFSDLTDNLSVSGDTSDPSFVNETWDIPKIAKSVNKNIKVAIHTRNIKSIEQSIKAGYDKFVFSIDENVTKEDLEFLNQFTSLIDIRLSFVMTTYNYHILEIWSKNLKEIYDFKMTIRPEVHSVKDETISWTFYNSFLNIRSNKYKSPYDSKQYTTKMKNGAIKLKRFPNIWYWDYNVTNPKLKVTYLFSNDIISSNCLWEKII